MDLVSDVTVFSYLSTLKSCCLMQQIHCNRRYTYTSVNTLGSQTFENSKQCWEWLRWVIGQSEERPTLRRERRPTQKRLPSSIVTRANSNKRQKGSEPEMQPAVEVGCAFADNSDLLDWVTSCPNEDTLQSFQEWAEKLGGIVTDKEPEEDRANSIAAWTSTEDAITLLETIER